MNYRMRRQGEDLGVFTLEELQRRRESGELTGGEYIQREGTPDWQPLDLVLQQGYRVGPPPLPLSVSKGGLNPGVIWLMVAVGVIFFIAFCAYVGISFQRGYQSAINSSRSPEELEPIESGGDGGREQARDVDHQHADRAGHSKAGPRIQDPPVAGGI